MTALQPGPVLAHHQLQLQLLLGWQQGFWTARGGRRCGRLPLQLLLLRLAHQAAYWNCGVSDLWFSFVCMLSVKCDYSEDVLMPAWDGVKSTAFAAVLASDDADAVADRAAPVSATPTVSLC